jgi:CheY-like chemotaxis protein
MLRLLGHEVRVAYDGPAAIESAHAFHPDVGLVDIAMPGMTGHDVARLLRGEFPNEPLLLVAVTGFGREEDRLRSQEAGFDGHLVKPVDLPALNALLAARPEGPRRRTVEAGHR